MSTPGRPKSEYRSAQHEGDPMSLQRCPGCKARWAQGPICLRCGCDLTLVQRAEAQARQLIVCAVQAWARGDRRTAAARARAALALEHSPLARRVLQGIESAGDGAVGARSG